MWWSKHKWKLLGSILTVAVLAAAFWYGGNAPGLQGWTVTTRPSPSAAAASLGPKEAASSAPAATAAVPSPSLAAAPAETVQPSPPPSAPSASAAPDRPSGGLSAEEKLAAAAALAGSDALTFTPGDAEYSAAGGMSLDPATGKDRYLTDPVPAGKPIPVEPQDAVISDTEHTCTLSISCATILDNLDWLDPEKRELVPEDGWILEPTEVTFYEGESVFNVLQRTCKQKGIHMEFSNTPMYNSAYIEGIHNLYEFDCGELSGWMYQVNGWFPNYGCSRYALQEGDVVRWQYTCTLGVDLNASLGS